MDLYLLNYKHILVVLTDQNMRQNILKLIEQQEVDVMIKFADSYLKAAKMIDSNKSEPFSHVVLNLSFSNQKLKDFIEFIMPNIQSNPDYLIEYTSEGELMAVTVSQEEE